MTDATPLWLGNARDEAAQPIQLPAKALLRHVMALGSSGSGKTVFCKVVVEEAVRAGIPVICVDPQGDLCSLLAAGDPEKLVAAGVDPALAQELADRADVVIFTPASSKGVQLSVDPARLCLDGLDGEERQQAITRSAALVGALLGFESDSDDGAGLAAVLDECLQEQVRGGKQQGGLAALAATLDAHEADGYARFAAILDAKKIRTARQRLARLEVGARRLLFHGGSPLDVDMLLGRAGAPGALDGKTRISVIYLNSLASQENKDFFVASLAERLYSWMLEHPSTTPQALFYVDEVAPFIPPVRKPVCKEALQLIFKQARKYGVCCLMATQNPGDVDYKAMAQFGTWALGRLTTKQDLKKVEPTVKALDPVGVELIMKRLPKQKPGQFIVLSPDNFERAPELATRWLLTAHETWDEERIEAAADEHFRSRFAKLGVAAKADAAGAAPGAVPAKAVVSTGGEPPKAGSRKTDSAAPGRQPIAAPEPSAAAVLRDAEEDDEPAPRTLRLEELEAARRRVGGAPGSGGVVPVPAPSAGVAPNPYHAAPYHPAPAPVSPHAVAAAPFAAAPAYAAAPPPPASPYGAAPVPAPQLSAPQLAAPLPPAQHAWTPPAQEPARATDPRAEEHARVIARLGRRATSAKDLAETLGVGEKKARSLLAELLEAGHVRSYKDGRSTLFYAANGPRPDLGLEGMVLTVLPRIDPSQAHALAREHQRTALFGFIGAEESVERVEAQYHLLYRLDFEEKVAASFFQRLSGPAQEHRVGAVYLHPRELSLMVFGWDGITFHAKPSALASDIADIDGQAHFVEQAPGVLPLEDADVRTARPAAEVAAWFVQQYQARPTRITQLFFPSYRVWLRRGAGNGYRLLRIDGLVGKPLAWPGGE